MGILGKKWKVIKTDKNTVNDEWKELEQKRRELFELSISEDKEV